MAPIAVSQAKKMSDEASADLAVMMLMLSTKFAIAIEIAKRTVDRFKDEVKEMRENVNNLEVEF